MTLEKLNVGEVCRVNKILKNANLYQRFCDIGIISGTKMECVLKSPFGDPKAYLVRGTVIAIRSEDAKMIDVFKEDK